VPRRIPGDREPIQLEKNMSGRKLVVCLILLLVAPCVALAQEGPRWTYVEAGFIDFSPDDLDDDDGYYGEGSLNIFRNFHLLVEYDSVGDYTFWSAGGGWHGLLGETSDLFAEILWQDVDVDTAAGDISDDGYEGSVGIRWSTLKWLELKGQVNYVDLSDGGSDTTIEGEAMVKLLNGRLGLGLNYEAGDADVAKAFARFSFGK
jgi:hypothetical protein